MVLEYISSTAHPRMWIFLANGLKYPQISAPYNEIGLIVESKCEFRFWCQDSEFAFEKKKIIRLFHKAVFEQRRKCLRNKMTHLRICIQRHIQVQHQQSKLRFKKLRVCLLCWKLYIILVFWMYYYWDTIHCSSFARYWAFVANHLLMTKMKSAYIKILIWFQFGITWSADECRYLGRS